MNTDHRKKANKKRNGRSRYEKGHSLYSMEGRNPLKSKKGDFSRLKYNPIILPNTLKDIWPN